MIDHDVCEIQADDIIDPFQLVMVSTKINAYLYAIFIIIKLTSVYVIPTCHYFLVGSSYNIVYLYHYFNNYLND